MLGRSRSQALGRYLEDANRTLNLVVDGRLVQAEERRRIDGSVDHTVSLGGRGRGASVPLRGSESLSFQILQTVNVRQDDSLDRYTVTVASYSYWLRLESNDGPFELLNFQWTPDAPPPQRRHPHLHVGWLVTSGSPFRGGNFKRLHIPTGPLSLEALLLFAVEELGVEPARGRDRAAVVEQLRASERGGR